MLSIVAIAFVIPSVAMLLRAELSTPRDIRGVRLWKPTATVLVFASCMLALNGGADLLYTVLIGMGLAACLVGDVFLIDTHLPASFMRGLLAFLVGHLLFVAAFSHIELMRGVPQDLTRTVLVGAILFLLIGLLYVYLRESLGPYRMPVLIYMIILGLLVHRAFVALDDSPFLSQPVLAALGTLLFVISDTMLALARFMFPSENNRDSIWVLSSYYAAISCLALSCLFT
jgi:uncharacterized membrane protein YhhN